VIEITIQNVAANHRKKGSSAALLDRRFAIKRTSGHAKKKQSKE
jgi:hypothetical protein